MGLYDDYNTNQGIVFFKIFCLIFMFLGIIKLCAHIDYVDPGLAIEMMEIEWHKNDECLEEVYEDIPADSDDQFVEFVELSKMA